MSTNTRITAADLKNKIKEIDAEVAEKFRGQLVTVSLTQDIREVYELALAETMALVAEQNPEMKDLMPYAWVNVFKGLDAGTVVSVPNEELETIIGALESK
ncbi:hypothetical protein TOTORO_01980 [Serratia phage vB_SmaS-Totoro]|nr:hypothetical protein TOTORO_01980 [Serratia phage vB_SmaS-Totoro]